MGLYPFFIIAHELGHIIQYAEECPRIQLHQNILEKLRPHQEKISAYLNSMISDFTINAKLKRYGITIPFTCYKPPFGDRSTAFCLAYIFRYVTFRRLSILNRW